jgi:predicted amidohydrolase
VLLPALQALVKQFGSTSNMGFRTVTAAALLASTMAQIVNITVFQPLMTTLTPSKADQLSRLTSAFQMAASAHSLVLIVPELYLTGYNLNAPFNAEPEDGPSIATVRSMAMQYNQSISFTFPEKDNATGFLYDTVMLIHRNGSTLVKYRKVNLATGENMFFQYGNNIGPVVDLDGISVGLLICFDMFLPEPSRILALQDVEFIIAPTANGYPYGINVLSSLIIPTRGLENNAFVAYVNWVQDNATFPDIVTFYGQTTVSDPGGNIVYLGAPDAQELAVVPLNFTSRYPGNTAHGRPAADLQQLCDNVTSIML